VGRVRSALSEKRNMNAVTEIIDKNLSARLVKLGVKTHCGCYDCLKN
jgi:hypothetical protein